MPGPEARRSQPRRGRKGKYVPELLRGDARRCRLRVRSFDCEAGEAAARKPYSRFGRRMSRRNQARLSRHLALVSCRRDQGLDRGHQVVGRAVRRRRSRSEDIAVRFHEAEIAGVFVVEPEPQIDERGFFARIYCPEEFSAAGIKFSPVQINMSRNAGRYTLRGLHYQDPPHAEAKLVYVARGAVYDVVVDLRRDSATFGR